MARWGPVPSLVGGGVPDPEIGTQVDDDPPHPCKEGRHLHRGAVGQGQENNIGLTSHLLRGIVGIDEIREPGKGRIDFGNRNPGKPAGSRRHDLHLRMAQEQPQQFLTGVAASPVDADLYHRTPPFSDCKKLSRTAQVESDPGSAHWRFFRGPLPLKRSIRKDDCLSAKREFRLCSEARGCRVEKKIRARRNHDFKAVAQEKGRLAASPDFLSF